MKLILILCLPLICNAFGFVHQLKQRKINFKHHDWELKQVSSLPRAVTNYDSNKNIRTLQDAIESSRQLVELWRQQSGVPGVVVGLSISGRHLWTQGFGYIDIENNVTTHKDSVWRLASISKPLTAALVGKLIETGRLDLDDSIWRYLSTDLFPIKTWNGQPVDITVREAMLHTAGLHLTILPNDVENLYKAVNVSQTLAGLKNEGLLFRPGTEVSYSNYGFQIIGAIIESIVGDTYQNAMKDMFEELGMRSTSAEKRESIIRHRPRYYYQNSI
jgi:serine beta-lactamase-like protein LACTB, mitochondrial